MMFGGRTGTHRIPFEYLINQVGDEKPKVFHDRVGIFLDTNCPRNDLQDCRSLKVPVSPFHETAFVNLKFDDESGHYKRFDHSSSEANYSLGLEHWHDGNWKAAWVLKKNGKILAKGLVNGTAANAIGQLLLTSVLSCFIVKKPHNNSIKRVSN